MRQYWPEIEAIKTRLVGIENLEVEKVDILLSL
jgi:hypothetical protein